MKEKILLTVSAILLLGLSGCGEATKEELVAKEEQMKEQRGTNKKSTNLSDLPPGKTWNIEDAWENEEASKDSGRN